MRSFKRDIYRVCDDEGEVVVTPPSEQICKRIVSFEYKCSGATTATFGYMICGETVERQVTVDLYDTGGTYAVYDASIILEFETESCIVEGSFHRISGLVTAGNPEGVIYGNEICTAYVAPPTYSFYYEGIYTTNDPAHPTGGTIVYIDAYGVTQESTYLWNGECREILAQSITSNVGAGPCSTPTVILETGTISSTSQPVPDNGCVMFLDSICYIDTANEGMITSGDTVYHDESGTNPIIGGNQYYKISLINKYVILVSDLGVINVDSICA